MPKSTLTYNTLVAHKGHPHAIMHKRQSGVMRSDVICDFPLKDMLAFHKLKGAEGTILVTRVSKHSSRSDLHAYIVRATIHGAMCLHREASKHNSIDLKTRFATHVHGSSLAITTT